METNLPETPEDEMCNFLRIESVVSLNPENSFNVSNSFILLVVLSASVILVLLMYFIKDKCDMSVILLQLLTSYYAVILLKITEVIRTKTRFVFSKYFTLI